MRRVVVVFLVCLIHTTYGQRSFQFNSREVLPGTKEHFTVPISDLRDSTFIPVTVFHGMNKGPVLGITAGVHGYEYSPILAGQRLINRIAPETLNGTVILVQAANVESFLGRSPYVNPLDDKNLNRSFPGDPNGTITERIADYISTRIIPRCTHFVDAHSGDAPEDLMPYSAYYHHDDRPEISSKGREMAMYLGFDHVVTFQTTTKEYMKEGSPSLYCSAQAFKLGLPAADIECGRLGLVESTNVDRIVEGLMNLMHGLNMTSTSPNEMAEVIVIEDRSSVKSEYTGFFYPRKSSGDYVTKGMRVGYVTDFFNRKVQDVYANANGILLFILGTPPVNKGESLVTIGLID